MTIVKINVQEPYYSFIVSGQKTVEGRLNKGKFAQINLGDILVVNEQEKFEVIEKNSYISFKEMIKSEGLENVIPDKKTEKKAQMCIVSFTHQNKKKILVY
ncbi:MAG: ASCH domain-containing protein [Candidatus Magasanikbacteria bacterium]|nr:ASCH domain-containing protein [Candidatus Magasanikbacteria bacterium]